MARQCLRLWVAAARASSLRAARPLAYVSLMCLPLFCAAVSLRAAGGSADEGEAALQSGTRIGHIAVANPAELSREDAEITYQAIRQQMAEAYGLANVKGSRRYSTWQRFNSAPYRSAQHGERFVNNYGNRAAAAYGRFEDAGTMPVGAILAKDSFTVTDEGHVYAGALFLMEKMPAGLRPEARDWRYTVVLPDGSLYGTTGGEGSDQVTFCADCHVNAGEERDHLFLVPEDYRK